MNCDQSVVKSNLTKSSAPSQSSSSVLSLDQTQHSDDGVRPLDNADIPGFEYELPENINDNQQEPLFHGGTPGDQEMPRFEEHRHPITKFFVRLTGVLTLLSIIYQGVFNIQKLYTSFICALIPFENEQCDFELKISAALIELLIYTTLEIYFPVVMLVLYVLFHLSCCEYPRVHGFMASAIRQVVHYVEITTFYHSVCCLSSSVAMLSSLSSTFRPEIWLDYLSKTSYGLMWMYGFFNLFVFVKLLHFDQIRKKELRDFQILNMHRVNNI